jgi:hypothetical protein
MKPTVFSIEVVGAIHVPSPGINTFNGIEIQNSCPSVLRAAKLGIRWNDFPSVGFEKLAE